MVYYTLTEDHRVVPTDRAGFAAQLEDIAARQVAVDTLPPEITISTVFLGLAHSPRPGGTPALFETMIFGGPNDQWQHRYVTWEQAVAGHAAALAWQQGGGDEP